MCELDCVFGVDLWIVSVTLLFLLSWCADTGGVVGLDDDDDIVVPGYTPMFQLAVLIPSSILLVLAIRLQ